MTLNELYRAAKTALEPVTEDPTFEAACLLEHFCGANRTELLLHGDKPAESEAEQAVLSALEKRKTGEPLQYLLGEWDFMSLTCASVCRKPRICRRGLTFAPARVRWGFPSRRKHTPK